MVFRGFDGLDELTTTSESDVWLISEGREFRTVLDPRDLGLEPASPFELEGGPPEHNAQAVRDMVAGKPGAVRDIVVLNAAAALLAYRGISTVTELVAQLEPAVKAASEAIDSGKASQTLEAWVAATQR